MFSCFRIYLRPARRVDDETRREFEGPLVPPEQLSEAAVVGWAQDAALAKYPDVELLERIAEDGETVLGLWRHEGAQWKAERHAERP